MRGIDVANGLLNTDELDFLNNMLEDNDEKSKSDTILDPFSSHSNSSSLTTNSNNISLSVDNCSPSPFRIDVTTRTSSFQQDVMNHVALSPSPRSPVRSGSKDSKKCTELFLGGTDLKPGLNQYTEEPHFCSNMQCFCCDHIVLRFPDRRWSKDTDYMFMRNNYPNNVDAKLIPAPGWCAFCCQCVFREENSLQRLKPFSTNWVCRGHF